MEELYDGGWLNKRPLAKSYESLGYELDPHKFPGGDAVVDLIEKAIHTGAVAISGYGDASPLRLENLDAQMTEVLISESDLKLFNMVPRVASIQPRFEWIRHDDFGTSRRAPGFREGGAPKGGVSKWSRGDILNKYMGVRRGYTHQALITNALGGFYTDPIVSENRDGTVQLLSMIERWFTWGDKDIKDKDGNEVNYDGIYQLLLSLSGGTDSIVDMKGQPMEFDTLEELAISFRERGKLSNFSQLRTITRPSVLTDLSLLKLQAEHKNLNDEIGKGYRPGVPLLGYNSQLGYIPFETSIVLDAVPEGKMLAAAETGVTTAKPATLTAVAASDATSLMEAGTYYYWASSVDDDGETDGRASTATVVAAGEKVTLTAARVTAATAYRFYRGTKSDGSDAGWIATIAQPGSGDGIYVDLNQIRPNTSIFIAMNMNRDDVAIAQMSPLIKYPLARVTTQEEFLLLLYHVLAIKAVERVRFYKNIGRRV